MYTTNLITTESSCTKMSITAMPLNLAAAQCRPLITSVLNEFTYVLVTHKTASPPTPLDTEEDAPLAFPDPTLRPLTTLNWPYVPDESAFPNPLKRDDPKPLQLHQYEAIGGTFLSPVIP